MSVRIADTGVGIAPEDLGMIFDPKLVTSGARVRAGLGLPTCFQIVGEHRGHIDVVSELGVGTGFTVTLPRRPQGVAP